MNWHINFTSHHWPMMKIVQSKKKRKIFYIYIYIYIYTYIYAHVITYIYISIYKYIYPTKSCALFFLPKSSRLQNSAPCGCPVFFPFSGVLPRNLTWFTWKWWFPIGISFSITRYVYIYINPMKFNMYFLFWGLLFRWTMLNFGGCNDAPCSREQKV